MLVGVDDGNLDAGFNHDLKREAAERRSLPGRDGYWHPYEPLFRALRSNDCLGCDLLKFLPIPSLSLAAILQSCRHETSRGSADAGT